MQKNRRILCPLILLFCMLILIPEVKVQAAANHVLKDEKDGVVKEDGKLRLYKNGKKMKNKWGSLGKKKYYFGANGNAVAGIRVIKGKFFYFNSKTCIYSTKMTKKLRSAAKYERSFAPLKKMIGAPKKSEYYDSCYGDGKDGILTYKNFTVFTYLPKQGEEKFMGAEDLNTQGGVYSVFHLSESWILSSGTGLNERLQKIVDKKTKSEWGEKKKLKHLFKYIEKKYGYLRKIGFSAYKGWEKVYAEEMFSEKKGSCYHYAAAYAFLAKKATGLKVRVGVGKTNGFNGNLQPHAWVEIKYRSKWFIFDPNLDKYGASSSGKYFCKSRKKLKSVYNGYSDAIYVDVSV